MKILTKQQMREHPHFRKEFDACPNKYKKCNNRMCSLKGVCYPEKFEILMEKLRGDDA